MHYCMFKFCKNIMVKNIIVKNVYHMFEESFAPILPDNIQTISSKTCVKRYTATAKAL